jgi:carbon monoxide dehydrogenase subunit G
VRGKLEVLAWFELIADRRPFFNRVGYGADVPGQTFTANAPTTASPANVWARLQVPATWEGISGVDSVFEPRHDESGQLAGFKFHSTAAGRQYAGVARPGPREHEVSLTWDIATSEIKGWVRVDLQPLNAGTRVEVTMHVESISMMASFGFPFIASAIANGFQQTVDNFAAGMTKS